VNVESAVLYLVLSEENREVALEGYGRLKSQYFVGTSVLPIFKSLKRFYDNKGEVPTFQQLLFAAKARGAVELSQITALQAQTHPEVDLFFAIDTLLNAFAQKEALKLVNNMLDGIRELPGQEIVEQFSMMALELDEKLDNNDEVYTAKKLRTFKSQEDLNKNTMPLGISNRWDSIGGVARQCLYLIGGRRGSGKSIVAANITVNAYKNGLVSPFFTIEMHAQETDDRMMAMLAQVPLKDITARTLGDEETRRLAKVKSDMFVGGDVLFKEWDEHSSFDGESFEKELVKLPEVEDRGKMVLIDNRELTLTAIDSHLARLRSEYGDRLGPVVIDYVNQIIHDSSKPEDMYDWKTQIHLAKQLKNLARKYDVPIISPYQTDASGEARLSKGLLDAVDGAWAIKRDPESDLMTLECQKLRGATEFDMNITMSTTTLRIDPQEVVMENEEGEVEVEDMGESISDGGFV